VTRRTAAPTPISVAAKTAEAADTLMAWLQTQPRAESGRFPDTTALVARPVATAGADAAGAPLASAGVGSMAPAPPVGVAAASGAKRAPPAPIDALGEAVPPPAAAERSAAPIAVPERDTAGHEHGAPLRLAHPNWLYHRLSVVGPAADLTDFRAAAAHAPSQPGRVPDPGRPDLRRVARRHALAVGRIGHSRACPFDLHALLPVPEPVLRLGPDDPAALDWLWANWGTTLPLRHVEAVATDATTRKQLQPGEQTWTVAFWSADWTPWRALTHVTARWPALRFAMRPLYDTP
jgi:hypothetical protein